MMIRDLTDELPKHAWRKYSKRYLDKIDYIVLHHTGGDGTIKAFANYHISKGWPGIGYHYIIDKEGNIYQTNRIDTISYNVGGKNSKVIGIALIGNYEREKLSECQKDSIESLVFLLRTFTGNKPVVGHFELKSTICPGKYIKEFIKKLN